MRRILIPVTIVLAALALSACGSQDAPAGAVEAYLEALVAKDGDQIVNLACADWQDDATVEVDSLEAVEARLDSLSCETTGEDDDVTLVGCTGSIVLTYEGEDRPIDLSARTFQTVQEGGDWLVCGYR